MPASECSPASAEYLAVISLLRASARRARIAVWSTVYQRDIVHRSGSFELADFCSLTLLRQWSIMPCKGCAGLCGSMPMRSGAGERVSFAARSADRKCGLQAHFRSLRIIRQRRHRVPTLEILTDRQFDSKKAPNKRYEILNEYLDLIREVKPGKVGKLTVSEGETSQTVRRRLSDAADASGYKVEIVKKDGDDTYFRVLSRPRGRKREIG